MEHRFLVEIMGPAGSGKSTLVRALCAQDDRVVAGLDLAKMRYVRPLLRKLGVFFPVWLRNHREDRWLDRREIRSIARLETWSQALDAQRKSDQPVTLFDHGPLYRLARFREFGPALTHSEPFQRWWHDSLSWWHDSLDLVVCLEAPDEVLLRRVEERGHWYLSGSHSSEEKHDFLARYRRAFDEILQRRDSHVPKVLRIRSDEKSVDEIAAEVLAAFRFTPGRSSKGTVQ